MGLRRGLVSRRLAIDDLLHARCPTETVRPDLSPEGQQISRVIDRECDLINVVVG